MCIPSRSKYIVRHCVRLLLIYIMMIALSEHMLVFCRLLDMGFEKSVKEVVDIIDEHIGKSRQVVLLSATLSAGKGSHILVTN